MSDKKRMIWKYSLPAYSTQAVLHMPVGALILPTVHMDTHNNVINIWAMVEVGWRASETPETEPRSVYIFGTGHTIPSGILGEYIGTVLDGTLVWHLYEGVRNG